MQRLKRCPLSLFTAGSPRVEQTSGTCSYYIAHSVGLHRRPVAESSCRKLFYQVKLSLPYSLSVQQNSAPDSLGVQLILYIIHIPFRLLSLLFLPFSLSRFHFFLTYSLLKTRRLHKRTEVQITHYRIFSRSGYAHALIVPNLTFTVQRRRPLSVHFINSLSP